MHPNICVDNLLRVALASCALRRRGADARAANPPGVAVALRRTAATSQRLQASPRPATMYLIDFHNYKPPEVGVHTCSGRAHGVACSPCAWAAGCPPASWHRPPLPPPWQELRCDYYDAKAKRYEALESSPVSVPRWACCAGVRATHADTPALLPGGGAESQEFRRFHFNTEDVDVARDVMDFQDRIWQRAGGGLRRGPRQRNAPG